MRSQLNRLYNQLWTPLIRYASDLLKFIRKNDEDDNHFNNPFVIH
jgi:hypothetical protein